MRYYTGGWSLHNMVLGKSDGFHFAYFSSLHKVKIIQSKICLDGSGNDNEANLIFDASQLSSPSCFFSSHFFFLSNVDIGSSQKAFHESQLIVPCREKKDP